MFAGEIASLEKIVATAEATIPKSKEKLHPSINSDELFSQICEKDTAEVLNLCDEFLGACLQGESFHIIQ